MLYNFLYPLAEHFSLFNLFQYLTFRTGAATLTALFLSFIFGPHIIQKLKTMQPQGQPIRNDGPQSHIIEKKGTPTMGGVLILICVLLSTLLWADISNAYIWVILFIMVSFGGIGFLDDYLKLTRKNAKGVSARKKLLFQSIFAFIAASCVAYINTKNHTPLQGVMIPESTTLMIPFLKSVTINLGWFFFVFAAFVIVGTSNAVNLTDGLDGLAIMPTIIACGCFALISYVTGHMIFAKYLQIPFIQGTGELAVFCGAIIGAGLGFLWYNAPPASVFMGDTGSLSLGASLGTVSIITKHELVLAIVGGLFVMETVSVIIQIFSYKLTGKRVFRMAPLHHHFEHKGWSEATIVIRFWIIAFILALIGLSTLKLR